MLASASGGPASPFSRSTALRQQHLELLPTDLRQHTLILSEDGIGKRTLRRLQLENLLFHRVTRDKTRRHHLSRLSNAMCAIDRLRFDRRIPPRVEQEHVVGRRQIQSVTARFEADQK